MSATEAAHGILEIAVAKMSLAVRGVSVERGYDPRDFAMLATGGGGPPHAVAIARDLHIPTVIIPNLPAHFSALGMLMADVRHDYVRTVYRPLADADLPALIDIYAELAVSGRKALEAAGMTDEARGESWWMDLRYVGQEFWLQVPVQPGEVQDADVTAITARFHETHNRRFGHAAPEEPVELVNVRLTALGERPKIVFPPVSTDGSDPKVDVRPVYFNDPTRPVDCPVYRRERLQPGLKVEGPCVIEEYGSTTILFAGDRLEIAETGELIISVGDQ
jgi:N-methylhydantoinase A